MVTTKTKVKRAFADTPHGQIHYVFAGSGDPILLLHQTPRSTDEYAEMVPILAQTNLVISMDTLGYGDSDIPDQCPSIEDYAGTVPLVLDSMGIKSATVVGHHTGSFVAAEAAISHPERVDKLILSGFFNMDAAERERNVGKWPQWEPQADGSHLTELWQKSIKRFGGDAQKAQRSLLDVLKAGTAAEYGHWAVVTWPQEERLPMIQCPTLLVWGTKDLQTLDRLGWQASADKHKVGEAIPRCKEVEVPEGTTDFPKAMPGEFSQLIQDFIGDPGI